MRVPKCPDCNGEQQIIANRGGVSCYQCLLCDKQHRYDSRSGHRIVRAATVASQPAVTEARVDDGGAGHAESVEGNDQEEAAEVSVHSSSVQEG